MVRAILRYALWWLAAIVLLALMLHAKIEARGERVAVLPFSPARQDDEGGAGRRGPE